MILDLVKSKHWVLGLSSDFNETNTLHLNSETLKDYLKQRHEQWTARDLTKSFRTEMKNDQKTSSIFTYILLAVVATLHFGTKVHHNSSFELGSEEEQSGRKPA